MKSAHADLFNLIRVSPQIIGISSKKDGRYIEVSEAFLRTSGYCREEVIGHTSTELGHWLKPSDRQKVIDLIETQSECRDLEIQVGKKDGSTWTALLSMVEIQLENEECYLAIATNITKQKSLEDDLRQEKNNLQIYLDTANTIIVIIERNEKISYINRKGCDVLGLSKEESLGINWFDRFLPNSNREEIRRYFLDLMNAEQSCSLSPHVEGKENLILTHNNEERFYAWNNAILFDDMGKPKAILCTGFDITDKKRFESQALIAQKQLIHTEKLASIGTLAAGVAHEINNPVAIIRGYTEVLKSELEGEISKDRIFDIIERQQEALTRITNIINGLRTFSRSDMDHFKEIDLHKLINDALLLLNELYRKSRITLVTDFKSQKPMIKTAMGGIQQVLMNLLANAKDAIVERHDENGGKIRIETYDQDRQIILKISDNGIGIPKELQGKLFDPFFTTKEPGKGTGLGLSITRNILDQLGGKIEVESNSKSGTVFTVILNRNELI